MGFFDRRRYIVIYLKLRTPMCHRQLFRKISKNRESIQTHCNDRRNFFMLHVVNGVCIIIQNVDIVDLQLFEYDY